MRVFLVMLAAAVVAPAAAVAQSQVFVTGQPRAQLLGPGHEIAGPAPAGEGVVWGERRGGRVYFRSLAGNGRVSAAGSVENRPRGANNRYFLELTADAGQLAFTRVETACVLDCRDFRVTGAEVRVGPVGGPYNLAASGRCEGETPERRVYSNVVLVDGVLSRVEDCGEGRYVARELATSREPGFDPPTPGTPWAGTGYYVAVGGDGVRVYDVRTGQEAYRVADVPSYFAVGEDGLLVMLDGQTGQLSWAQRDEPFAHAIGTVDAPVAARLVVRDRTVAVSAERPDGSWQFTLFSLAGDRATQTDGDALGQWGFDGRRLAWASWPCRMAILRVWDPLAGSPRMSGARCPAARPSGARSRLDRQGRATVELSCPQRPALGCSGTLLLRATNPARRMLGRASYILRPGTSRRLNIQLDREDRTFVRRRGPVAVTAKSTATRRVGAASRDTRRVRFKLRG